MSLNHENQVLICSSRALTHSAHTSIETMYVSDPRIDRESLGPKMA